MSFELRRRSGKNRDGDDGSKNKTENAENRQQSEAQLRAQKFLMGKAPAVDPSAAREQQEQATQPAQSASSPQQNAPQQPLAAQQEFAPRQVSSQAAQPQPSSAQASAMQNPPQPTATSVGGEPEDPYARKKEQEQKPGPQTKAKKLNQEDSETLSQINDLIKDAGMPLTAENGQLARPPEQREIMALFSNGIFLVSKSHLNDPYVLKLESYARLRGITVERKIGVSLDIIQFAYDKYSDKDAEAQASRTQMQKDIQHLIADAVHEDASDIHIVVEQGRSIVEMRMNGVLRQKLEWRGEYGLDFCAACFAMADASDANYNPNEYQAARISRAGASLPDTVQALRLQFNPLAYGGRYMIARLLYRGASGEEKKTADVKSLGYSMRQFKTIQRMVRTPVGIGVVSGPTGSGKSTTLFQVLSSVMQENNFERNVITIEDPPERPIIGAKQMPVTNAQTPEERRRKFIQAISAAMRSDPDTIMIGEIRDKESAKLAVEAAMTGHQVWTTVHANDALMIINRLRDIGVEEYNLFTPGMIFGLVGQRLARKLCNNCKIPLKQAVDEGKIKPDLLERIRSVISPEEEDLVYAAGPGCEVCAGKKGYGGRTVLAEVIYPDETLMDIFRMDKRAEAKKYWVEELGGMSMMEHAISKMKEGVMSPGEIERVAGPIYAGLEAEE